VRLLANDLAPGARKPNEPRSAIFLIQFPPREITKSHFTSNSLTRLKKNSASLPGVKRIRASLLRLYGGAVSTIKSSLHGMVVYLLRC
jgi:hypothetical protein